MDKMTRQQAEIIFNLSGKDYTADEVRRVYRLLSLSNHPDAGGDAYKMQEINAAYKVLKTYTQTRTEKQTANTTKTKRENRQAQTQTTNDDADELKKKFQRERKAREEKAARRGEEARRKIEEEQEKKKQERQARREEQQTTQTQDTSPSVFSRLYSFVCGFPLDGLLIVLSFVFFFVGGVYDIPAIERVLLMIAALANFLGGCVFHFSVKNILKFFVGLFVRNTA